MRPSDAVDWCYTSVLHKLKIKAEAPGERLARVQWLVVLGESWLFVLLRDSLRPQDTGGGNEGECVVLWTTTCTSVPPPLPEPVVMSAGKRSCPDMVTLA